MTPDEILALTPEELRIRVAERKGWKVKLLEERDVFSGFGENYLDSVIREYALLSPQKQPIAKLRTNKIAGFLKYLPDLSDPREYMALMTEIWGKDRVADFDACGMYWNYSGGYPLHIINYGPNEETKELWQAIAKAWLIVVGSVRRLLFQRRKNEQIYL